ncbi:MAG: hypothetical protein MJZ75_03655 [Paludibacteraceae bacterium]|nr:hypothetical protein [Paludibacteraceae bacterium]
MIELLPAIQQKRIFRKSDVVELVGDKRRAEVLLLTYQKRGYIQKIRRDLYCILNLATGLPDVSRYEIACSIQTDACIAYHTALEYHGLAHQFWYDVQVATARPFTYFEHAECAFVSVGNKIGLGIEEPRFDRGVRVTNLERTIVDCILRMDLAGGAEEFLHCMEGVGMLRTAEIINVLQAYDAPVAYQKVGCTLELLQLPADDLNQVLQLCRTQAGTAVNFLTNREDSTVYQSKWKLYVPECLTIQTAISDEIV